MLRLRVGTYVRWFLRQCKGDIDAAGRRLGIFASARGDDDELATVHFVGSGSRVDGEGKRCFPKQLTGGFIEGAEPLVEVGCSDEQQSACANNGTAVIFRAGVLLAFCRKLRVFAERNLPDIFAGVQIDGVQSAPRRSNGGISFRVQEFVISGEAIFHGQWRWFGACELLTLAARQVVDQSRDLIFRQIWKARHSALSVFDGHCNLCRSQPVAHSDQRRHRGRRTRHFFSVADAALAQVDGSRAVFASVWRESTGPSHLIRIDVDDSGVRIHGGAAPFGATVEPRKYYRIDPDAEGNELPITAEFLELFQRPPMHCGSAGSQKILVEKLARKGGGPGRKRLLGSGHFAGHGARRVLARLDREKRFSVGAIKQINESLLCGLGYRIDLFPVALHGEKRRRRREIPVPDVVVDPLKMPDALARLRIQGNQAICEKIVTDAIGAIEIKCRRARGYIDNSALRIERHSGPIVRSAAGLPRIAGPGVIAKFTRVRDGVKRPAQLAGPNVVGANITRRGGKSLRVSSANDHQFLVNDARAAQNDRLGSGRASAQILPEVDSPLSSETWDWFARGRIQGIKKIHHTHENSFVLAIGPVREPAIGLCSSYPRVEFPQELATRGIQSENFLGGSESEEYARDDDRARLEDTILLGVETPRDSEALNVASVDLRKR